MVLKIIRVILLLFSMYGYTQYLVSKRKLKIELALPVLLSAIGAAVFLAGLLNVMKEVSALIFLFGAALSEDSETQLARIGHRMARLYQIMQEDRRRALTVC